MAKKNTYAAAMKQLSSKKANYEKGLAEARRMGNGAGIADYERRLAKLNSGMDELFQAQERAKAPAGSMMKYGGKTGYKLGGMTMPKYNEGGLTITEEQQKLINNAPEPKRAAVGFTLQEYELQQELLYAANRDGVQLTPEQEKFVQYVAYQLQSAQYGHNWNPSKGDFDPDSFRNPETYGGAENAQLSQSDVNFLQQFEDEMAFKKRYEVPISNRPQNEYNSMPKADRQRYKDIWETIAAAGGWEEATSNLAAKNAQASMSDPDGDGSATTTHGYRNWAGIKDDIRKSFGMDTGPKGVPKPIVGRTPDPVVVPPNSPTGSVEDNPTVEGASSAPAPFTGTPAPSAPATPRMSPEEAQRSVMEKFGDRLPGGGPGAWREAPLWNDAAGAPRINDIPVTDPRNPGYVDPNAPVDLTQSGYNLDFGAPIGRSRSADPSQSIGGRLGSALGGIDKQMALTAIGGAAQLLPDLAAKRRMQNVEGPVDNPLLRTQMMNTDIQTGQAIQGVRESAAQQQAMMARNFSNPAIAAAMQRDIARNADAQISNIQYDAAQKEMQLRNQNMMQANEVLNQNRMIDAQNRQRQIDFQNDLQGALAQQDMLTGQKLGGIVMDYQNRAADQKKWNLYKNMFNQGVLDRNNIDPTQ